MGKGGDLVFEIEKIQSQINVLDKILGYLGKKYIQFIEWDLKKDKEDFLKTNEMRKKMIQLIEEIKGEIKKEIEYRRIQLKYLKEITGVNNV